MLQEVTRPRKQKDMCQQDAECLHHEPEKNRRDRGSLHPKMRNLPEVARSRYLKLRNLAEIVRDRHLKPRHLPGDARSPRHGYATVPKDVRLKEPNRPITLRFVLEKDKKM
ncbi:hypothetical protein CRE_24137 [Caenorhabditis remanei]|uniref:Uncharacterized protein n=1 Tax=Caenorhabditis remanei TaxID=31234 RepID=E3N451_CAERE|nr:hypothetical protein CRE_24137 [Caenorhabditis remanei]